MPGDRHQSNTVFRDDDRGFCSWLDDHQDGYFINSFRSAACEAGPVSNQHGQAVAARPCWSGG